MPTDDDMEIELKFPLLNPKAVEKRLNSVAVLIQKDIVQKDTYFNPPKRDFLAQDPVSEWLRVRKSPDGSSLTYKKWHNKDGNECVSCDEHQTRLSDADAFEKILKCLGFRELIVVDKKRTAWQYKGAEIALDYVNGLGIFIELEAKGDHLTVDSAKVHLLSLIRELGAEVGQQDHVGYPMRLLQEKRNVA